ncbi:hypothetical protein [Acidovorax sp.]|uniref:hypothetical protein n=1 Tax=Acidovorax sp. TaxID=1872122 RepID=UPI003D00D43D
MTKSIEGADKRDVVVEVDVLDWNETFPTMPTCGDGGVYVRSKYVGARQVVVHVLQVPHVHDDGVAHRRRGITPQVGEIAAAGVELDRRADLDGGAIARRNTALAIAHRHAGPASLDRGLYGDVAVRAELQVAGGGQRQRAFDDKGGVCRVGKHLHMACRNELAVDLCGRHH